MASFGCLVLEKIMTINWLTFFYKHTKKYTHFDYPLNVCDKKRLFPEAKKLISFLEDRERIAKHAFFPFIGYDILERRISKIDKTKKYAEQSSIIKKRPIRYASHVDSLIYSYYAAILYEKYEDKVKKLGIGDVVIAYRKSIYMQRCSDNISSAYEVFNEIKNRNCNCVALAFDIKSFYDNIDHKNLKKEWANLLGFEDSFLPEDHFNIYKSLTNYSFVDVRLLAIYILCEAANPVEKGCVDCMFVNRRLLPKVLFKNREDFRKFKKWYKKYKNVWAGKEDTICGLSKYAFEINPGLLDKENPFGIPQGSSLSSLLANIYMLPFDKKMNDFCKSNGAMYRRYSDDILIICDVDKKEQITKFVMEAISERGKHLYIHPIIEGEKSKSRCYDFTSEQILKDPLQYLGFTFDGKNVRIRGSSYARYLRKSKRGIKSMRLATQRKILKLLESGYDINLFPEKLYRKTLYKTYTHLGSRNFWAYTRRAFKTMESAPLKKQLRNHFNRVKDLIDKEDVKFKDFMRQLKASYK